MRRARRIALASSVCGLALVASNRASYAGTCGTDTKWCVDDAGAGAAYTTTPVGLGGYSLNNVYVGAGPNLVAINESTGASVFAGGDVVFGSTIATQLTPIWWNMTSTTVFFATTDGVVHANDGLLGGSVWTQNIVSTARPGCNDQVTGTIAVNVAASLVYVATNDGACAAGQNRVYALNATTGAVVWTFNGAFGTTVNNIEYGVRPDVFADPTCTPAVTRNHVVFADKTGNTFILDSMTGALLNGAGGVSLGASSHPASGFEPQYDGTVCGASYIADNGNGSIRSISVDPTTCGTIASTPCTIAESYSGPYTAPIQFSVARGAANTGADRFLVNDGLGQLQVSTPAGGARCVYKPATGNSVTGTPFEVGGVAYTATTEGSLVAIPVGPTQKTDGTACNGYQERFFSASTSTTAANPSVDIMSSAYVLFAGDQAGRITEFQAAGAPFSATYTAVVQVTGYPANFGAMTVTDSVNAGDTAIFSANGIAPMPRAFAATDHYQIAPTSGGGLTCTPNPATNQAIGGQDAHVSMACVATPCAFGTQHPFPTGTAPIPVAVADFNGDGKPDLGVANASAGTVSVLLGSGTGTFATQSTPAVGSGPQSLAAGDLNGDGKPDLAVLNEGSASISILLGSGTGTFTKPNPDISLPGGPLMWLALGDFNGDGKLDIAVAATNNGVYILLGSGTGTFAFSSNPAVAGFPNFVVVGDFNGDRVPDLAVSTLTPNVTILIGSGSGTFAVHSTAALGGGNPNSVAVGDFNGDGKSDLAVASAGNTVTVLLGSGTGTFATQSTPPVGSDPQSLAVGDFNGDGKADLAVANTVDNDVTILLGSGTGTFATQGTLTVGASPEFVAVGDFDTNGTPDLAVANTGSGSVSVLLDVGACCSNPTTNTYDCGSWCGGSVVNCATSEQNSYGPSCASGACAYAGCESGYSDCDGNHTNGCETHGACPGHVLHFANNSAASWVTIPGGTSMNNRTLYTIEGWIEEDTNASSMYEALLAQAPASGNFTSCCTVRFLITPAAALDPWVDLGAQVDQQYGHTMAQAAWHHFAATCNSGASTTWVDGTEVGTGSCQDPGSGITGDRVTLGIADGGQWGLTGKLAEIRMSNVVRYASAFTPQKRFVNDANTTLLLHFDEGSGATVSDSSGNGNNGAINGSVTWVVDDRP